MKDKEGLRPSVIDPGIPEFPVELDYVANFMRLSSVKAAQEVAR